MKYVGFIGELELSDYEELREDYGYSTKFYLIASKNAEAARQKILDLWWEESWGAEKNTIAYRGIENERYEEFEDIIKAYGETDGNTIIRFLEKYQDLSNIWSENLKDEDKTISEQNLYKLFKSRVWNDIHIAVIAKELK